MLQILNSLSGNKEEFKPQKGDSKNERERKSIYWYSCGITPYAASHLGHARNYITFDIIRRILTVVFGFSIFYVENSTDIDDKIIIRAKQNYLMDKWTQRLAKLSEKEKKHDVLLQALLIKLREKKPVSTTSLDRDGVATHSEIETSETIMNDYLMSISSTLLVDENGNHTTFEDKHDIFLQFAHKFEAEFRDDMAKLNVLEPTIVTRVSDYIPEMIQYIETIEKKGYAYRGEKTKSVYFDVAKFIADGYNYDKFCCSTKIGEDSIHTDVLDNEKKDDRDFVLWKCERKGEPVWSAQLPHSIDRDNNIDVGRPGWHIECSTMADAVLAQLQLHTPGKYGPCIDIHSGGADLAFPQHQNEIAQARAYRSELFPADKEKNDTNSKSELEWSTFFLHSGHLAISGRKMSKSLKNFITIKELLQLYTPRHIRLFFLGYPWNKTVDFSDTNMLNAAQKDAYFENFLNTVENHIATTVSAPAYSAKKWNDCDWNLTKLLEETEEQSMISLKDNFGYHRVLDLLTTLATETNKYLTTANKNAQVIILKRVADYIKKMFSLFGVEYGKLNSKKQISDSSIIDMAVEFRSQIRQLAISTLDNSNLSIQVNKLCNDLKSKCRSSSLAPIVVATMKFHDLVVENLNQIQNKDFKDSKDVKYDFNISKGLLNCCNVFRDQYLFDLGVIIKDEPGHHTSTWKQVTPLELEILKKQNKQNKQPSTEPFIENGNQYIDQHIDQKIDFKKCATLLAQRRKDFKKWEYAHLNLYDFFSQVHKNDFVFDENKSSNLEESMPTLAVDGKPLTKQKLKEVTKLAINHRENRLKFLERQKQQGKDFRVPMMDEIKRLEAALAMK